MGGDVIFFNSQKHPSGHIWLTGDNRTGAGDGDDEQIIVKLNSLNENISALCLWCLFMRGANVVSILASKKCLYSRC
jgi:tellurium resistance protein TerD